MGGPPGGGGAMGGPPGGGGAMGGPPGGGAIGGPPDGEIDSLGFGKVSRVEDDCEYYTITVRRPLGL